MIWESCVLNLMRGGPRHNEMYETQTLATSHKMGWVVDYRWTEETVTGSLSGRVARVWVYSK